MTYSNPNKQKDKFGALVSTWLRCRPRWAPAHRRPPPCPALTIIASFCLPDYLDCYNRIAVPTLLPYHIIQMINGGIENVMSLS